MKKSHKQVVGLVSLGAVAAMTIFAATIPSPGAAALSTVTDTITVRVVADSPDVNFLVPSSNVTVTHPNQDLQFDYNNISAAVLSLTYTDENGVVTEVGSIANITSEYEYDTFSTTFNLDSYGYGTFEFVLTGEGVDGVTDTDAIAITYQWMNSELVEDDGDGDNNPTIVLDYDDDPDDDDPEDGTDGAPTEIKITVVDEDGDVVYETTVTPPTDDVEIPFDDIPGLPEGDYTIIVEGTNEDGETGYHGEHEYHYDDENNNDGDDGKIVLHYDDDNEPSTIVITVTDEDGNVIYEETVTPPQREIYIPFDEIPDLPDGDYNVDIVGYDDDGDVVYTEYYIYHYERVPVPNTGSFFRDLNVSKEDFVVTALIMFFVISTVGVGVILKKKHQR